MAVEAVAGPDFDRQATVLHIGPALLNRFKRLSTPKTQQAA